MDICLNMLQHWTSRPVHTSLVCERSSVWSTFAFRIRNVRPVHIDLQKAFKFCSTSELKASWCLVSHDKPFDNPEQKGQIQVFAAPRCSGKDTSRQQLKFNWLAVCDVQLQGWKTWRGVLFSSMNSFQQSFSWQQEINIWSLWEFNWQWIALFLQHKKRALPKKPPLPQVLFGFECHMGPMLLVEARWETWIVFFSSSFPRQFSVPKETIKYHNQNQRHRR